MPGEPPRERPAPPPGVVDRESANAYLDRTYLENAERRKRGEVDLQGAQLEDITYIVDLPGWDAPAPDASDTGADDDDPLDDEDRGPSWRLGLRSDREDAVAALEALRGRVKNLGGAKDGRWFVLDEETAIWEECDLETASPLRRLVGYWQDVVLKNAQDDLESVPIEDKGAVALARRRFEWAEKVGSERRTRDLFKVLATLPEISITQDRLDLPTISVSNGILEYGPAPDHEISCRQRHPEDMVTRTTTGAYRDGDWWKKSVAWEFFSLIFPDAATRDYALECFAYIFFERGNADQLMFGIYGPSGSGKTILCERICEAMGPFAGRFKAEMLKHVKEASSHTDSLNRNKDKFGIFSDELGGEVVRVDGEILKTLNSGAAQEVRGIFQKSSETPILFTMFFATNKALHVVGDDPAAKRRIVYIPTREQSMTTEQGRHYGAVELQKPEERDAIVTILAHAYQRLLRRRDRGETLRAMPPLVSECTEHSWAMSQGHMSEFAEERYIFTGSAEDFIVIQAEFPQYLTWAALNSIRHPHGKIKFVNSLTVMGASRDNPDGGGQNKKKVDGRTQAVLYGIRLRRNDE